MIGLLLHSALSIPCTTKMPPVLIIVRCYLPPFQDKYHLYFLFDLMSGGDLMDVLVAEAKVINRRVPESSWQIACLAPNVKMLQVCEALLC